jgi:hypothetical protein
VNGLACDSKGSEVMKLSKIHIQQSGFDSSANPTLAIFSGSIVLKNMHN